MQATSYILTWREAGDPLRRANLEAVLGWLAGLALGEIILVEQDVAPSWVPRPDIPNLRVLFAYNPGKFNKSWGLNVGARHARGSLFAFGDADVICHSLPDAIATARAGVPVVRPFPGIIDLNAKASTKLRQDLSISLKPGFGGTATDRTGIGEAVPLCGGLVLMAKRFFTLLGGWDERFLGWGGEDDAMDIKIRRAAIPHRILARPAGFHLHHRRANTDLAGDADYRSNLALLQQLQTMPEEALRRLCEITWQLAGNREMHRPMEKLA